MRPLPIAGKPVFNSICGNTCNRCQLKKNQVINTERGQHATVANRRKTCRLHYLWERNRCKFGKIKLSILRAENNRYQARENKKIILSAEKHANGAKRGKTCGQFGCRERCNRCRAKHGKEIVNTERGKTCNRCQARKNMLQMLCASSCCLF